MPLTRPTPPKAQPKPSPHPRRPWPILALRMGLPAVSVATFALILGWAGAHGWKGAPQPTAKTSGVELTGARLIGADSHQRPFLIIADDAARATPDSPKLNLTKLVLQRDEGGPNPLKVTAPKGVYDQAAGRLELSGGVKVSGPRGDFDTPTAVYDVRAGEMLGEGGVSGVGQAGALKAGSVSVKDGQAVYRGGVSGRLNRSNP